MTSRRLAEQHVATLEAFLSLLQAVPSAQRTLKLTNADAAIREVWPQASGITGPTPVAEANMLFWPEAMYVQARTSFDDLSEFSGMTEVVNAAGRVDNAQFERAPFGPGKSTVSQYIARIATVIDLTRLKLRRRLWPWVVGGVLLAGGLATAVVKHNAVPTKLVSRRRVAVV